MKKLFMIAISILTLSFAQAQTGFQMEKQMAKEQHKLILLNFSGSDWCGPCIRMHKEIFGAPEFLAMAEAKLVMVNADFPRNKKHQLTDSLKKENEALADQYNPGGAFPYTVLLDAEGNVIQSWEGLPKETASEFTLQIKALCDARK